MKPIKTLLSQIKESGLIYNQYVTASIISYEAGHLLRNLFYASMVGDSDSEEQLRAGWMANGKVELSDLITQARVLAEVCGWDWQDLVDTGEAKLTERIDTYKQRGVRPNQILLNSLRESISDRPSPPVRKQRKVWDGD